MLIHPSGKLFNPQKSKAKDLSLIHISEPTRQAEISYAVFCLKKKNLRAHETDSYIGCRLLLEKKKQTPNSYASPT